MAETAGNLCRRPGKYLPTYLNAVPADFQALAELEGPYEIVSHSAGGFDTVGLYQTYHWIDQLWAVSGITAIPTAIPNGDGLGSYPDLFAAICPM